MTPWQIIGPVIAIIIGAILASGIATYYLFQKRKRKRPLPKVGAPAEKKTVPQNKVNDQKSDLNEKEKDEKVNLVAANSSESVAINDSVEIKSDDSKVEKDEKDSNDSKINETEVESSQKSDASRKKVTIDDLSAREYLEIEKEILETQAVKLVNDEGLNSNQQDNVESMPQQSKQKLDNNLQEQPQNLSQVNQNQQAIEQPQSFNNQNQQAIEQPQIFNQQNQGQHTMNQNPNFNQSNLNQQPVGQQSNTNLNSNFNNQFGNSTNVNSGQNNQLNNSVTSPPQNIVNSNPAINPNINNSPLNSSTHNNIQNSQSNLQTQTVGVFKKPQNIFTEAIKDREVQEINNQIRSGKSHKTWFVNAGTPIFESILLYWVSDVGIPLQNVGERHLVTATEAEIRQEVDFWKHIVFIENNSVYKPYYEKAEEILRVKISANSWG